MNSAVLEFPAAPPLIAGHHLEVVKWIAFGLMLLEHVHTFALETLPGEVYSLGRAVFPLFAFALMSAVADKPPRRQMEIALRILAWSVPAFLLGLLVRPLLPYNVLATLSFGLMAFVGFRHRVYPLCLAALALSLLCEFGPYGVFTVWAAGFAAVSRGPVRWAFLVASLIPVSFVNASYGAFLALPILLCVSAVDVRVPRLPQAFYWLYSLQWPALAVLKAVL